MNTAHVLGLVSELVEPKELEAHVANIVTNLLRNGPNANKSNIKMRSMVYKALPLSADRELAFI